MTTEELESRVKKTKGLIVEKTGTGYMVTSSTRAGGYLVSDGERLECSCPDYYLHRKDPDWKCKHIIVVEQNLEKKTTTSTRFAALEV